MITMYVLNERGVTLRINTVEVCRVDDWENQIGGQEMNEEEGKIKSFGLRTLGINARY